VLGQRQRAGLDQQDAAGPGVVVGEHPGSDGRPERAAPQDEDVERSGVRVQRLVLAVEDLLPGVGGVAAKYV